MEQPAVTTRQPHEGAVGKGATTEQGQLQENPRVEKDHANARKRNAEKVGAIAERHKQERPRTEKDPANAQRQPCEGKSPK
eukprot:6722835-Alexandrium_andersonii.AAC.1